MLNPKDDVLLEAGDELLVVAEGRRLFRPGASHTLGAPEGFRGVANTKRHAEWLILGTSPNCRACSGVRAVRAAGQRGLPDAGHLEGRVHREPAGQRGAADQAQAQVPRRRPPPPDDLKKAATADLNCVLVVADTEKATDEADARTVMAVLLLRDLFKTYGDKAPRIISEILDPRTRTSWSRTRAPTSWCRAR